MVVSATLQGSAVCESYLEGKRLNSTAATATIPEAQAWWDGFHGDISG